MSGRFVTRKLLLAVFLVCVLAAAFMTARYFLSLRVVTVNFENTSKVDIYKTGSLDSGKADEPYKSIVVSGEEIKIPKGNYTAYYEGNKGYDSKYVEFSFDEDYALSIKPNLSQQKLDEMLEDELLQINKAVEAKLPAVKSLYSLQTGKLYENGTYYGATLKNTGNDYFNNDTLRVILKKQGNAWVVVTDPPSIYFNKFDYPNIPKKVLSDVNAL